VSLLLAGIPSGIKIIGFFLLFTLNCLLTKVSACTPSVPPHATEPPSLATEPPSLATEPPDCNPKLLGDFRKVFG
jgi:hypothetical protein